MASGRRAIATRKLRAIDSKGLEFELTIAVGEPYEVSAGEWACPASMDGLHGAFMDIRGLDSWQAMQLAYQMIAEMLAHFVEDGGRIVWYETGETLTPDELFPRPARR